MGKNYYRINVVVKEMALECLQFKVSLQRAVNKAIDTFYYNQEGDSKTFYKDLELIRKTFSSKVDHINGAEEVFHHFEQDLKSFKDFSKQLQGLSKEFYSRIYSKSKNKKSELPQPIVSKTKNSRKTDINNGFSRG